MSEEKGGGPTMVDGSGGCGDGGARAGVTNGGPRTTLFLSSGCENNSG
jgi:hypothetical protein